MAREEQQVAGQGHLGKWEMKTDLAWLGSKGVHTEAE